jgi:glutaminyl-peptide cyclotransferase
MFSRVAAAAAVVVMGMVGAAAQTNPPPAPAPDDQARRSVLSVNVPTDKWSGDRAMDDIAALLKFTPRSLDTPGHQQTIDYIKGALATTSAMTVSLQTFRYQGDDGSMHTLTNVIGRLNPDNPRRIIVATHYDSIVRAYRDAADPQAPMPGANNSASGVALLLETARMLSAAPVLSVGIDFVFFDGEEGPKSLGAGDPNWKALGSPYFAQHLTSLYPKQKPEQGVVFDMVCDRDLNLSPELSSLSHAKNNVNKFWAIGNGFAPKAFVQTPTKLPIGDDQDALSAAGIPSFLVIDFDYEPWFNTTQDTIDKCSSDSLAAIGRTLITYLYAS